MKYFYLVIIALFTLQGGVAQNYKFGKVSKEDFNKYKTPASPDDNATVIYRSQTINFEYADSKGFFQQNEIFFERNSLAKQKADLETTLETQKQELIAKLSEEREAAEKLLTEAGVFKGINVAKGNNDPKNEDKDDYEVDALAGATITGDGISAMIKKDLKLYLPYFQNLKK